MGRPCTVCSHPRRKEIDGATLSGATYRDIATRFEVSKAAAHRHARHVHKALVAVSEADPVAYGRAVLAQVNNLTVRAVGILDRAEAEGDLRAATGAIREARGCLELVARLEGHIVQRHAHLHAHAEDDDLERRMRDVAAMPDELRDGMNRASHWLVLHRGEDDAEATEVIDIEAEPVS